MGKLVIEKATINAELAKPADTQRDHETHERSATDNHDPAVALTPARDARHQN